MLGRSKSKPKDLDYTNLDSAVNELTKQTEALLKTFEEKPKPVLPKRHAKPASKGHSFDIIKDPAHKTRIKANLKVATPVKESEVSKKSAVELLPEHASPDGTTSESEQLKEVKKSQESVEVKNSSVTSTNIVAVHKPGSLHITEAHPSTVASGLEKSESEEAANNKTESSEPSIGLEKPTKPIAKESLNFKTDAEEIKVAPSDQKEEKVIDYKQEDMAESQESSEPVISKTPNEDEAAKTSESSDDTNQKEADKVDKVSTELFAPDFSKVEDDQEDKPNKAQKPTTIFDTEEYHPELHDWSKLEKNSHIGRYVAVLLLSIIAAAAYFIISGQKPPFLN